jgi:hypothetical protein
MSNRRKLRSKPPTHRSPRHSLKLIDRLGKSRPTTRIGIASLLLGVVGVALTLYFGFWPRSPEPVIGKPIPATTGGKNPAPLLKGQPCVTVQDTAIILYNLRNAVNCAYYTQIQKPPVIVLGTGKSESYCANSYVIPRPEAYRCVVQVNGINTIADPCFGVDKGQVECQLPGGLLGLLNVINVGNPKLYNPSLSWNWLPFMGHTGGGWICAIPLAEIELQPVRGHQLLFGRDALNYNGAFVAGRNNMYYAEDLAQGSQSTWSVLLEAPNNPGVFTRESVTQAWY